MLMLKHYTWIGFLCLLSESDVAKNFNATLTDVCY